MTAFRISSWFALLVSILLWGIFGYLVWQLYVERDQYISAASAAEEADLRGQSASRLHATVRDTEVERAAINSLLDMGVLRIVEILETTARQAGATEVSVGAATPQSVTGAPAGLTSVSVVINMQGSFSALVRAMGLYETLTIPSMLEQFSIENIDGKWRATARVRAYHFMQ